MPYSSPEVRICQKWTQLKQIHKNMVISVTRRLYKKCLSELERRPSLREKSKLADQVYEFAVEQGIPITKSALKKHVMNKMLKLNRPTKKNIPD